MSNKYFSLLTASAVFGLAAMASAPASATTSLTLTPTPGALAYQVSAQSPCIIGDFGPDQAKGGCNPKSNNIGGGYLPSTAVYPSGGGAFQTFENLYVSPTTAQYTVSQFSAFPVFSVGIDENSMVQSAGQIDNLIWFRVYVGGVLEYEYAPQTPGVISSINNGTGFSDYILSTVDLSGFAAGANVVFDAKWQSGDGNDYFFIVPAGTPTVPEPGTLALLGLGLAGLGFARRRRTY